MMNKMKSCCSPHSLMHALQGIGIGILLATWVEGARLVWLGVLLIVIAAVFDVMRKKACDCCCEDEKCDETAGHEPKDKKCC